MNRYKVLIAGLLLLAGVILFLTLRPSTPAVPEPLTGGVKEAKRPAAQEKAAPKTARTKEQARAKAAAKAAAQTEAAQAEAERAAVEPKAAAQQAVTSEQKTPREQAVATWEKLVDQVIEQKDVPVEEQAKRVKEAFDKLDKEDQMDGIHRSLNLVPDEQFPALYAILYDKTENPEVLDAIFSDALNRPESIKNPLMKELVKDKTHPCFFESARILDVIGELNVKPAPAATPAPTPTPSP